MSDDIYIDVNYLTESERDAILQVLAKDEELRKQEKRRISVLKNELDEIKKKGASKEELESSRVCARCRVPLGFILNCGALCPKCESRVCKECRKMNTTTWLCILCAKIREVRAESGAWFFEQEKRKGDRPQLYGSALVRASFRRAKPQHQPLSEDPGSPPVIFSLNLNNHDRLHRPVPVHMSRLPEKEAEEEEEEKKEWQAEVNQNYKQYVKKANRVQRKPEEDQNDTDEQEKLSSSSQSSTPRGSPVNVLDNDVVEVAYQDDTVFEHMKKQDDSDIREFEDEKEEGEDNDLGYNGYHAQKPLDYEEKVNDWNISRSEESPTHDIEQTKGDPVVEVKSSWHEVAHEWGEIEQPVSDTYPQNKFLSVRSASPDSETTGEFFTPLTTPIQSGPGTPALSDYGASEGMGSGSTSDVYEDAGDATPIQGARTPVLEVEEDDNPGNITVINPEITCTDPNDVIEPEEGSRTPTQDDDIDQAFACYERDHPSGQTKTLQEQLNILTMGSRESIVSYYSDAGEGRFGNVTVTGEVLFGLKYNKHKQQLEIQIHRAKDIAAADQRKGRSDPYAKVYLLPDKTKGGKKKTKTRKNTLNPDFDEILTYKIGFEEMLTRTLWLALWNHDTFGHNDFLGEVMLPLDTYQDSGFSWDDPSPNWYPLRERRPEPSLMSYCGDLTVSLMFERPEEPKEKKKKKKSAGKLHIKLKEARNLPSKDANGFSDPFCKSYLLPDQSRKTKHKTQVVKKNLNPVWNHAFCYENLTLDELRNRVLELTVWDYDRGSSNDFLGGLRLGLGSKIESWDDSQGLEREAWQIMLERPNSWHEYTLNLRSSMDSQVD